MHADHSVTVSQSHRRNSEKLKTRPHIQPYSVQRFLVSCFRMQLTADASFLLQINYLDHRINICAVTVETIYTNATVKYISNTDFNFRYWLSAFCVLKITTLLFYINGYLLPNTSMFYLLLYNLLNIMIILFFAPYLSEGQISGLYLS